MFKQPSGRAILAASLFLLVLAKRPVDAAQTPVAVSSVAATLTDCYQRALKISETLAISDQEIRVIEAQYRQGVGSILPDVSWNMTQFWQDTSGVAQSSGGVQGTLLRSRLPTSYFQVQQPLFNGFKEFNAIRGFKAAHQGAEYNRDQAALNLLGDVAEVFYVALDLQQELEVLQLQRSLTEDRMRELERRVRLGRSRDSEVLSSQVELASVDAQIEDSLQRWATARQTLYFFTEVPLSIPLKEVRHVPEIPTLDTALTKSTMRPDLQAADRLREQQTYQLRYAKGGYLPSLDITGKYYTERVGYNQDVKWDALLNLGVPIFSGFQTTAQVQQAKAQQIEADLAWSRLKRLVHQQVETAHQNLTYTITQTQIYTKAVELAKRNYQIQQEEYRLGLINNLQVFQVLNDLQDLKTRQLRSEASAWLNEVRLRIAMGQSLEPK